MPNARRGKKETKVERAEVEPKWGFSIDAKTHRRLLGFLNAACSPEDLCYAPQNEIKADPQDTLKRPDVDERPQERLAKYLEVLSMDLSAATYGQWSDSGPIVDPATKSAINVVHAALLRTGWVIFIEAACNIPVSRTPIWNRSTGEIHLPAPPTDNLYGSGHSFLSDGKLFVVGGGVENGQTQHPNMAWKFDPANGPAGTWEPTRDSSNNRTYMNRHRWYPTVVTLGDEPWRVLIAASPGPPRTGVHYGHGASASDHEGRAGAADCGDSSTTPVPAPIYFTRCRGRRVIR